MSWSIPDGPFFVTVVYTAALSLILTTYLWYLPWQFVLNDCHRRGVLHVPNSTLKLFKIRQSENSLKLGSKTVSQYLMMTSITGKPYMTQFKKLQKRYSG